MKYSDPKLWFSREGRINRQPYFFAGLAAGGLIQLKELVPADMQLFYLPVMLLGLYMSIMIGVKRAHDRGRTGYFMLLFFIPLLNLWPAIELLFFKGSPGPNEYGSDPLEEAYSQPTTS